MDAPPLKICLIIREFWPLKGGLTLHALRLCQELSKLGHTVEVITPFTESRPEGNDRFWATETPRKISVEGVTTHVIGLNRLERIFLLPLKKLRWREQTRPLAKWMLNVVFHRKFREFFHQFDIIHYDGAGQEFMGFAAATVAKSLSKPFIIQPSVHLGQWGHLPIDHEFFRLADAMIAHSTIEKRYLESIVDKKTPVHLVFNGIDELPQGDGLQFREKHSLHGPLILFLGRKTDDKGYFLLRQAYKAVRSEIPDCHLVNIGPGDSVAEDTPGVVELGYVSDQERSDALFACSFLCVPSEGESFGLVFLEAGRASKPYLARDLELFEELLGENQKTGIRIGDREHDGQVSLSPDQLARSLISLLQSPESDLQQMGAAGRKNSRRFLWDNIVPRFEEAYRKALAKDQDA